jgi:hypothetical protein
VARGIAERLDAIRPRTKRKDSWRDRVVSEKTTVRVGRSSGRSLDSTVRVRRAVWAARICGLVAMIIMLGCASSSEIRPFESDGCSQFSDGTRSQRELWKPCCYEHDVAYWRGGTLRTRNSASVLPTSRTEPLRS